MLDSDLPAPARHLMHALCVLSDAQTAVIPPRFTPSLTTLARLTGLNRATVARQLNRLEKEGWVVRERPDIAAARAKGERTRYALRVVAQGDQGSRTERLAVVAQCDSGSRTVRHRPDRSTQTSNQTPRARARERDGQIIDTVMRTLRDLGKPVDRAFAERTAEKLIKQYPRKPVTYYEAIIRRDPAPHLPTPTPPPFRAERRP